MKSNKFQRGRPRVADKLKRVQLITTVSPETMRFLNKKAAANGRVIDELVMERKK